MSRSLETGIHLDQERRISLHNLFSKDVSFLASNFPLFVGWEVAFLDGFEGIILARGFLLDKHYFTDAAFANYTDYTEIVFSKTALRH